MYQIGITMGERGSLTLGLVSIDLFTSLNKVYLGSTIKEGRIGEVGLGAEYDINQYDNILDIDFTITI